MVDHPAIKHAAPEYASPVLVGTPLFTYKGFSVYLGAIPKPDRDMLHYLVLNDTTGVVEGAAGRLLDARLLCAALGEETEKQEISLEKGGSLVNSGEESGEQRAH